MPFCTNLHQTVQDEEYVSFKKNISYCESNVAAIFEIGIIHKIYKEIK